MQEHVLSADGSDNLSEIERDYLRRKTPPPEILSSQLVRVVDLFSGCGGLSLGAMEACRAAGKGFAAVAAVDSNPLALRVYQRNFPCNLLYPVDIMELLDGKIGSHPTHNESLFLRAVKRVDILLAGPPCQGHSDLNNHTRRRDPRNILYERVARFAEIARPSHFLIENVSTIVHAKERILQRTIDVMNTLGYRIESGVVDLCSIGVPQKRKRHVLVGSRSKRISLQEVVERHRVERERSVWWAISDLVREPNKSSFAAPSRHTARTIQRIQYLHQNGVYDLPNKLRPRCHRNGGHSYKSMYGRLRRDQPAQTITSGFGSPGQGRFVHPTRERTITPHEAARLQFFPDFFDFTSVDKRTTLAEMIGNAAPMKLSFVFCLEMLR